MDVKGTNPALPVNTEKAKALAAALAQIENSLARAPSCAWAKARP